MIKEQLAIETYKHTQKWLPSRFRIPLKRYINEDRPGWKDLKKVKTRLKGTPYIMELDLSHWHQRWTYIKGHYPEPHISRLLSNYLTAKSVFIDIGANIGVHTLLASAKIGNPQRIWAIEPNPHSFMRLNSQLQLNQLHGIHLHQVALGNSTKTVFLDDCGDMSVASNLRSNNSQGCEVPMLRGDDLFTEIPFQQHGICKIDVEGYELEIIRGLAQFIATHPSFAYIVEVSAEWLEMLGGSAKTLFECFYEQGFSAYEIQLPDGKLQTLKEPLPQKQYDVFFAHESFEF